MRPDAASCRKDSAAEQHQRNWRKLQAHPEPLLLQQEPLHEQREQMHMGQDHVPQQETGWQQQAQQREYSEWRKELQPELGPPVQVQQMAPVQQAQGEPPAEHQQHPVRREMRQESRFHHPEEAEQPSGSPARRALVLHSAAEQLQIVPLQHEPSLEGERRRTVGQQHALYEQPCRPFQQQSEPRQHPELQRQQLPQEPNVQILPQHQRQQQPVDLAEQNVAPAELKVQRHVHEHLQQKYVVMQQQGSQPDLEPDSESLEDVLAAIADVEEVADESVSISVSDCLEQSASSDEQKVRRQQASRQREPEVQRQQGQERPPEEHPQQEHQREHREERLLQEQRRWQQEGQRQQGQDRQLEPQTVKPQFDNVEGKQHAHGQQVSSKKEPSELRQVVHAVQVDLERWRQPAQRENRGVSRQQRSSEAQQLTGRQPNEQQSADVQTPRSQRRQQERKDVSFFEDSLQQEGMSESADNCRQGHEGGAEVQQGSGEEGPSLKKQPQVHAVSGTAGILQQPEKVLRATEVELEEEVCDFLEARFIFAIQLLRCFKDLPPAAVARWSDYLRLREQQQQRRHEWRQQQQQQLWRNWQLEERPPQRRQRKTDLLSGQTAAAPFMTDVCSRASGESPTDGEFRTNEHWSTANCLNYSSELSTDARRSPFRPAIARSGCVPCSSSSPSSVSRTPSQVVTSPRSAHAAALASSIRSRTSGLHLNNARTVNDPGRTVERVTSSNTGDTSSSNIGGFSGSSGASDGRFTGDTGARCSSNTSGRLQRSSASSSSAGNVIESISRFCDTSSTTVHALSPRSSHSHFSSVDGGSVPTASGHACRPSMAQAGAASALDSAHRSCSTFLSPAGAHTRNSVHIPAAPAHAAQPPASSPAARAVLTCTALPPRGASASDSARTRCRALRPAAQEQSQRRGSFFSGRAAAASALSSTPLSLTSASPAPGPGVPRGSAAPAGSRGDGDPSTTMRRPVPLEVFFQLRGNRPGATTSRGSLLSFPVNQAAAAPTMSRVVSDGNRLSYSAATTLSRTTLSRTPERLSQNDATASSSTAPTGAPTYSPSATVSSTAARPAGAHTAYCRTRGVSSTVAGQVEAGSRSVPEGNAPTSGPEAVSVASVGIRSIASASQGADVAEQGNSAAPERRQTHSGSTVAVAGGQLEADAAPEPATRGLSHKTVEGVKRRRGNGTAAFDSGNTRRFIYLKTHEECIVCFVEIRVKGEVAMVEDCRHCFCCACIARWIKKSKTCPLCRRPITTVELWRQTPGALTKNPLAYTFLRRLRPDKNNILKPVCVPRRRAGAQQRRRNNQAKTTPSSSVDVDATSIRHASVGEEAALGL